MAEEVSKPVPDKPPATAPEPVGDSLPDELNVTAYVGPYIFPDIRRRRIAATILAIISVIGLGGGISADNIGVIVGGVVIGVISLWFFLAAWPLAIDQTEALAIASRTVGFAVGHASAQIGWTGLRSRPSWRILVYSTESPPDIRGLVEIDAVDGRVIGDYLEANPEDWSDLEPTTP